MSTILMEVQDLSGRHLGKTVAVAGTHMAASGVLSGVEHKAEIIEERTIGGVPRYDLGQSHLSKLTFVNRSTVYVEPTATVELLD